MIILISSFSRLKLSSFLYISLHSLLYFSSVLFFLFLIFNNPLLNTHC